MPPSVAYDELFKALKPHPKSTLPVYIERIEHYYELGCEDHQLEKYFNKIEEAIPKREQLQLILDSAIYNAVSDVDPHFQKAAGWFNGEDLSDLEELQSLLTWYGKKESALSICHTEKPRPTRRVSIKETLSDALLVVNNRIHEEKRKTRGTHARNTFRNGGIALAISLLVVEGKFGPDTALHHIVDLLSSHPLQKKTYSIKDGAVRKTFERFWNNFFKKRCSRQKLS